MLKKISADVLTVIILSIALPCEASFSFDLSNRKETCGTRGSLNQRLENCSHFDESTSPNYRLLIRTENQYELYFEVSTGKIWSSRIVNLDVFETVYNNGVRQTKKPYASQPYSAKICDTYVGEELGFLDLNWRLPSKDEYKVSEKLGLAEVFKDMGERFYWTSSRSKFIKNEYSIFSTSSRLRESFYDYPDHWRYSVRCIAQPILP